MPPRTKRKKQEGASPRVQRARTDEEPVGVIVRVGIANDGIEFCTVLHQPVQAERHNIDIDPHKTTHDALEFNSRKLPAL